MEHWLRTMDREFVDPNRRQQGVVHGSWVICEGALASKTLPLSIWKKYLPLSSIISIGPSSHIVEPDIPGDTISSPMNTTSTVPQMSIHPQGQQPRHRHVQPVSENEQGAIAITDEGYESYGKSRTIMITTGLLPISKTLISSCPTHLHRGGRIEDAVTQGREPIHIGDRLLLT